jgi:NhaP-type Na+/H+ and K+/H+ antiporter
MLELFDLEDVQLEDDEEYDTVGGLLYHRVGGVPAPGDTIEVEGLRLTVESTDGRRVGKVLVVRERRPSRPADDGNGGRRGEGQRRRESTGRKAATSRKRDAGGE